MNAAKLEEENKNVLFPVVEDENKNSSYDLLHHKIFIYTQFSSFHVDFWHFILLHRNRMLAAETAYF